MSSSNCVCYALFPSDYLPYCYSFVDCLVRASLAPLHVESALSAKPDWWKHTECRSPQNSHESSQRPDSPYKIHHKHNSSIGRRPYSYHKKHTTAWLQLLWQYAVHVWILALSHEDYGKLWCSLFWSLHPVLHIFTLWKLNFSQLQEYFMLYWFTYVDNISRGSVSRELTDPVNRQR